MKIDIITPYPLYISKYVSNEIERVISKNCDAGTSLFVTEVSYFIQRLFKGIQDLTNNDVVLDNTGIAIYDIEGIGIISYIILENSDGDIGIYIENIKWDFMGYYLYPHLVENKHTKINKITNLIQRLKLRI